MKKIYFPQNVLAVRVMGMDFTLKGEKVIKNSSYVIVGCVIVAPVAVFLSDVAKNLANDAYAWAKGKLVKSKDENKLTPKSQTLAEARSEAGYANYDDGQLVGKLIYIGDIVIFYGEFGTGKSVLALQLAETIATGGIPLIVNEDNGLHQPMIVLYYDGEMDAQDIHKIYGDYDVFSIKNLTLIRNFFFKDTSEWLDDLKSRLKGITGNVTVFLDNLSCITSSTSGNVIREFFQKDLKLLQEEYRQNGGELTFVFLAHTNKEGELAGSQNLNNFGRTVLGITSTDKADLINLKVVKNRKYGDMRGREFLLQKKQTPEGRKYDEYVADVKPTTDDPHKDGKAYYDLRQQGMSDDDIAQKVGVTRETVNRKINAYKKSAGIK